MNEAEFKTKIRKALQDRGVYVQSNTGGAQGVPDHWYSGRKGDLWVEYKYDPKAELRKRGVNKFIMPKLSPTQNRWLCERYREGRNVAVIVATGPDRGFLLEHENWTIRTVPLIMSVEYLLDFIVGKVHGHE